MQGHEQTTGYAIYYILKVDAVKILIAWLTSSVMYHHMLPFMRSYEYRSSERVKIDHQQKKQCYSLTLHLHYFYPSTLVLLLSVDPSTVAAAAVMSVLLVVLVLFVVCCCCGGVGDITAAAASLASAFLLLVIHVVRATALLVPVVPPALYCDGEIVYTGGTTEEG